MSTATIGTIPGGQIADVNLTDAAKIEVEGADGQSYWVPLSQLKATFTPEATWTPNLLFGGAATGMTYAVRQASYIRIGNLVIARCFIVLTSKGSSTGLVTVSGLPVASKNTSNQYTAATARLNSTHAPAGSLQAYLPPNSQAVTLDVLTAAGVTSLTDAHIDATSDLMLVVVYSV